ncbi:TPA: phosphoadenosine phosphosulfate reductase family protein [Pseudomonas aeruginosa]
MAEHNITSLSGGKDSLATALLMKEREVENGMLVFADTGNEHDLTYEYLDYLEQVLPFPLRRVRADFTST